MKCGLLFLVLAVSLCFTSVCYSESIDWDRLVYAVVCVESNGNPFAVGDNGTSVGLMQLSPLAIKEFNQRYSNDELWYSREELFDYCNNTKIGRWYLRRLHCHYGCKTIEEIACAYNWGIGNLRKKGIDNIPSSVRRYIKKVKELYNSQPKGNE